MIVRSQQGQRAMSCISSPPRSPMTLGVVRPLVIPAGAPFDSGYTWFNAPPAYSSDRSGIVFGPPFTAKSRSFPL